MGREYTVILYLRISREDGDLGIDGKNESDSIINQRRMLHSFVESKPEFYKSQVIELCDEGYSGTNFQRPAVNELLKKVKEREADCIIVKDFSRFGRNYLLVSDYVDQIFPLLGIRFISLNEGYDSNNLRGTASGSDMAFRNIVNEYYSKDISEKVRSGKAAKARQGAFLSPFAPIGYAKDKNDKNRLVIEEKSAGIVRRIFQLSGAGLSVAEIAKIFNGEKIPTPRRLKIEQGYHHKWWEGVWQEPLWDTSSITRILRDERYLGKVVYGKKQRVEVGDYRVRSTERELWIVVENCHEPIITEGDFQAAQQTLKCYREVRKRKKTDHMFTGKIRCGKCGYALVCNGKAEPEYHCITRLRTHECNCMADGISEAALAQGVWEAIQLYCKIFYGEKKWTMQNPESNQIQLMERQIAAYRNSCKNLNEQKAILYERKLAGEYTCEQYITKKEALEKQQENLKIKINQLEEKRYSRRADKEKSKDVPGTLKNYPRADRLMQELVMAFVDCIHVYSNEMVKIKWLFGKFP